MSLCRVVLVQSCVAGAVSHRESPREGGTSAAGQYWCLCTGPWVATGSLRSLSLDYHCCTHCWSERKAHGLILSVGCTDRGKTPPYPLLYLTWWKKISFGVFFVLKSSRGAGAVWTVSRGVLVWSLGGTLWELEVGLGWGTLVCVLAGSPLCVKEAVLKESFTERGSVKGMCRMWLGSSNGKDSTKRDIDGKKMFPDEKVKVMENENKMFNQKFRDEPSRAGLFSAETGENRDLQW